MKTSTKTSILENSFYGGVHRGAPIAGYEEFVLPVIEKVLASSRHLSATSLARFANRVRPGHDHRGCSKVHCAAAIAAAYCAGSRERGFTATALPAYIDKFCRDLRFASNGWSRVSRTAGDPAPIESDRDYIVERLAEVNAELAYPVQSEKSYYSVNRVSQLKSERYALERALKALGEGVGNKQTDKTLKVLKSLIDDGTVTIGEALESFNNHGRDYAEECIKSLVKSDRVTIKKLLDLVT